GPQERLGVLVVVVVVRIVRRVTAIRGDDLARRQRRAVVDGDDADRVHGDRLLRPQWVGRLDRAADHDRVEAVDLTQLVLPTDDRLEFLLRRGGSETVDRVLGHDQEQGRVNG